MRLFTTQPRHQIGCSLQRGSILLQAWRQNSSRESGAILSPDPKAVLAALSAEGAEGGGRSSEYESNPCRDSETEAYHLTVLLEETIAALQPKEGKQFFDGTLGGGGHSEALLEAGARVLGCDQDPEALAYASKRLSRFGDRFQAVRGNFSAMDSLLSESGLGPVDGILLDLGVSSRHLDAAERGFSFRQDGPLDMRMNPAQPMSAADVVNGAEEGELARIFWEFGEERASRRLARAIVERRAERLFERTADLAGVIESILPRGGRKHPATRSFQALRIAVNGELDRLAEALDKAVNCLKPGGVLAVITFHSLEDRIVKRFLRRHSMSTIDRPEWPAPRPNPDCFFSLPSRKPVSPSEVEQQVNPRSRSAKLRVGVRL